MHIPSIYRARKGPIAVSVIIPAFDEEETIEQIVRTAQSHPFVDEVIVVSDGSTDGTVAAAKKTSARVIAFAVNRGKGEAMEAGVKAAKRDLLVFLDADLLGLTTSMLTALIEPVANGSHDMFTLICERVVDPLPFIPDSLIIGGERALTRKLWNLTPKQERSGFDVEIALNFFAKKYGMKTGALYMPGLDQVIKEKKHGLIRGFSERVKMLWSCSRAYIKFNVFRWDLLFPRK